MGSAVGASLPIAVGVMISPLPVVAVVLMLVTPRAKPNSFAFLTGWFVGVALVGSIVLLLSGAAVPDDEGTPTWAAVVKIVLGALLLVVAVGQFRKRPREGVAPETPRWMATIDTFTPVKAAGLAVLLSAVNPKNLLLVVSGAAAIATAAPGDTGAQFGALAVFAVVASVGVALPLVIYFALGDRAGKVLDELKDWMVQNNAVIMSILLLVIGAKMIGDGIGAL
ncbi:Sap-like sulfolipid-1-addressing protein [Sediminihabitans luteus]|uniref:Sap-like sulfolipid-1-addressing protein n=1 Tax=Sediminihabitans luteus TaxID=1138585 RepID=A0A2M9CEQ0_9CELL|nr:GAP family protein [Sediminihabitans luteus]PJJ70426.1 Sap-like sulfolipid-1-addressing protein [Sediminihabitans luteus]GII97898.1 membrane protein [Sediminihabitans luteus]